MSYSDLSFRALSVLHKSRYLFNKHGFHNVGVDRIVREAEVPKASFYNYFHSKERLIEMCLHFQKDVLKEQVRSIIYIQKDLILREKLKRFSFYILIWMVITTCYLGLFLKLRNSIPQPIKWLYNIGIG